MVTAAWAVVAIGLIVLGLVLISGADKAPGDERPTPLHPGYARWHREVYPLEREAEMSKAKLPREFDPDFDA